MRYWRILNVDDENKKLFEDISSCLDQTVRLLISSYQFTYAQDDSWPYRVMHWGSLCQSWTALKKLQEKGTSPDIGFYDVKLVEGEDEEHCIDSIKNEIIGIFTNYANETINEITFNWTPVHMKLHGGFLLMSLTKKIFPSTPIILYTESNTALSTFVPYIFANLFEVSEGKYLGQNSSGNPKREWPFRMEKLIREKMMRGDVSQTKIRDAIAPIRLFLDRGITYLRNNRNEFNEIMSKFLNTDISNGEAGWTIGSFYIFEFRHLSEVNIRNHTELVAVVNNIHRYLEAFEWSKYFGHFVASSHFDVFAHHRDPSKRFKSAAYRDYNFDTARNNNLLKHFTREMKVQWNGLPCVSSLLTSNINALIDECVALYPDNKNDYLVCIQSENNIYSRFAVAKDIMRMRIEGVYLQIENACRGHLDNQKIKIKLINQCEILSADMLRTELGVEDEPMIVMPARMIKPGAPNLLGELILTTINSIHSHGFSATDDSNAITVYLELNQQKRLWIITIVQAGDKAMIFESLDKLNYFIPKTNGTGSLKSAFDDAKNWIDIEIRSSGIARNPHSCMSDAINRNKKEQFGGKTEFEYRISLAGEAND